uniref:uncharacterized protein LOC120343745 n=1 Tax=Styela clava TaxID=7725 RepID=UPI00193A5691|nr:uncharacterized protein LOC120343745 [Styela clava]
MPFVEESIQYKLNTESISDALLLESTQVSGWNTTFEKVANQDKLNTELLSDALRVESTQLSRCNTPFEEEAIQDKLNTESLSDALCVEFTQVSRCNTPFYEESIHDKPNTESLSDALRIESTQMRRCNTLFEEETLLDKLNTESMSDALRLESTQVSKCNNPFEKETIQNKPNTESISDTLRLESTQVNRCDTPFEKEMIQDKRNTVPPSDALRLKSSQAGWCNTPYEEETILNNVNMVSISDALRLESQESNSLRLESSQASGCNSPLEDESTLNNVNMASISDALRLESTQASRCNSLFENESTLNNVNMASISDALRLESTQASGCNGPFDDESTLNNVNMASISDALRLESTQASRCNSPFENESTLNNVNMTSISDALRLVSTQASRCNSPFEDETTLIDVNITSISDALRLESQASRCNSPFENETTLNNVNITSISDALRLESQASRCNSPFGDETTLNNVNMTSISDALRLDSTQGSRCNTPFEVALVQKNINVASISDALRFELTHGSRCNTPFETELTQNMLNMESISDALRIESSESTRSNTPLEVERPDATLNSIKSSGEGDFCHHVSEIGVRRFVGGSSTADSSSVCVEAANIVEALQRQFTNASKTKITISPPSDEENSVSYSMTDTTMTTSKTMTESIAESMRKIRKQTVSKKDSTNDNSIVDHQNVVNSLKMQSTSKTTKKTKFVNDMQDENKKTNFDNKNVSFGKKIHKNSEIVAVDDDCLGGADPSISIEFVDNIPTSQIVSSERENTVSTTSQIQSNYSTTTTGSPIAVIVREGPSTERNVASLIIDMKTGVATTLDKSSTSKKSNEDDNAGIRPQTSTLPTKDRGNNIIVGVDQTEETSTAFDEVDNVSFPNFADIKLPNETAEEKMARMFGLSEGPTTQSEADLSCQTSEAKNQGIHISNIGQDFTDNLNMNNQEYVDLLEMQESFRTIGGEGLGIASSSWVTYGSGLSVEDKKSFGTMKHEANSERESFANVEEELSCIFERSEDFQLQTEEPVFVVKLADQVVNEGETATFICIVTGHPQPSLRWQRTVPGKVEILNENAAGVEIKHDIYTKENILKIHRVRIEDEAEYTCIALNDVGFASSSAMLRIIKLQTEENIEVSTTRKDFPNNEGSMTIKSAQTIPKTLTIRVKERVIVRETYDSSQSESRDESTSDETSSPSSFDNCQQVGQRRKWRRRPPSPDYFERSSERSTSIDSGDTEKESVNNHAQEVIKIKSTSEDDLRKAVLLASTNNSSQSFKSDMSPFQRFASPLPMSECSASRSINKPTSLDLDDTVSESLFTVSSWPDIKSDIFQSVNASVLLAGIPEESIYVDTEIASLSRSYITQLVQRLIFEEEEFVSILRRADHIIKESSDLPAAVDDRIHEIFGDLEGLYHFHANLLLPELSLCLSDVSHLPGVFLESAKHFEQLHVSHFMNTSKASKLFNSQAQLVEGVHELSCKVGFDMTEVYKKPIQRIEQYQSTLKQFSGIDATSSNLASSYKKAIKILDDIPKRSHLMQSWCEIEGKPKDASILGQLIKEGAFQLLDSTLVPTHKKCKMRQLFLFDKYLVVCKLSRRVGSRKIVHSKYHRQFEIKQLQVEESPDFADDRTFIITTDTGNGENIFWQANLRAKTGDIKRSWCRRLYSLIQSTK